jgi:hypothetical protein
VLGKVVFSFARFLAKDSIWAPELDGLFLGM